MLRDSWRNIRYGARILLKSPGFTAAAVLTLALGIGATTSIFSVVYATLFEAMPYPKPDQLMMVWLKYLEGQRDGHWLIRSGRVNAARGGVDGLLSPRQTGRQG